MNARQLVAVAGGRDSYTPWLFRDALEFVEAAQLPAAQHGFVVAMYGSVLTGGRGQDLDLLAVAGPNGGLSPHLIFAQLGYLSGIREVLVAGIVAGETCGFVWVDDRGRLIDLSVVRG